MNIYDIPIALITQQYLDYLDLMQELNLDVVGEFLVMAATLIHIKSRMLLPRPDPDAGGSGRRIRAKRSCAGCSSTSASRPPPSCCTRRRSSAARSGARPDGRVAEVVGEAPEPEIEVDLFSLMAAFRQVLERARAAAARAAAARADSDRDAHRAVAGAAVGDRRLRLRGAVRRRADARAA